MRMINDRNAYPTQTDKQTDKQFLAEIKKMNKKVNELVYLSKLYDEVANILMVNKEPLQKDKIRTINELINAENIRLREYLKIGTRGHGAEPKKKKLRRGTEHKVKKNPDPTKGKYGRTKESGVYFV